MPVEVIKAKYGFYIPMDGAWQSEEDNTAFAETDRLYNELKENNNYVALIQSHDEYSHGYWVETTEREVNIPDHILKNYKNNY